MLWITNYTFLGDAKHEARPSRTKVPPSLGRVVGLYHLLFLLAVVVRRLVVVFLAGAFRAVVFLLAVVVVLRRVEVLRPLAVVFAFARTRDVVLTLAAVAGAVSLISAMTFRRMTEADL